jgi:excisionase family DNA binding protein
MAQPAKHYTVRTLSEELECSPTHIYNLVRRGELPCIKIGNTVRFPKQAIQDFLNQQWQSSLNTKTENGTFTTQTETPDGHECFQRALETRR